MGGGGSFYDRDVTSSRLRGVSGATNVAERDLSQTSVDKSLLPKDRRLACNAENPLAYIFDVTASMDSLPKIIYDKWPGIVGQISARKYLPDPEMSLAAVGDITSDRAPLQMADFSPLRNLDRHFQKIFFERKGGGQSMESYEVAAYYYAYLCDMPKANNPICLFTGDEDFREKLYAGDLSEHFGGEHQDTTATKVFADLLKKFKGNAFLVHRHYANGNDSGIVSNWRRVLGGNNVILLPQGTEGDLAIGDITLGVYAIVSGARTLEQYVEDMRTRPLDLGEDVKYEPQTPERIRAVKKALEPLKDFKPVSAPRSANKPKVDAAEGKKPAKAPGKPAERADWEL